MKKDLIKIILLAVLIRVMLMPFFFHPDIKTYHFQASFLKEGVTDIYSYLDQHKSQLPLKEEFVYFPLTYFFLGGYQIIASPFLGNSFISWLSDAGGNWQTEHESFRYLFILKLPYLILDLLLGVVLMSFFTNVTQRKRALILWLFNPFSLILIYVFSNVDIMPVFLTTLGVLFAKKNKFILAGLMLGLAAGFKAYPILFLPFLINSIDKPKDKVFSLLAGLGVFGLCLLPFIGSSSFQNAALVSGLTTRLFNFSIGLGFGETLMIGVALLSAIFFWQYMNKKTEEVAVYLTVVLLTIFSLIHFHIQWLLWIIPFYVLLGLTKKHILFPLTLVLTVAMFIPVLYADRSLNVSIFALFNPVFNSLPTPFTVIARFTDPVIIQSILHSIFAGGSLVISGKLLSQVE